MSNKISMERAKLLAELEYLIGASCQNSNSRNFGGFRYPLTTTDKLGKKAQTRSVAAVDNPDDLLSGHYAFGANRLYIFEALNKVVKHLEDNHDLKL